MKRLLVLAMLSTAVGAQTTSIEDVRLDYGKGEHRAALQKANRLLASSLQEPPPSEKYELLMVRGECQLQLKDRLGAITSFKSAAKCAGDVAQLANAKEEGEWRGTRRNPGKRSPRTTRAWGGSVWLGRSPARALAAPVGVALSEGRVRAPDAAALAGGYPWQV